MWLVQLSDTLKKYGTTTDAEGKFTLGLPPAIYELRISYIGCHSYTAQVQARRDIALPDICLKEDSHVLGEVTVKGQMVTYDAEGYRLNVSNSPHFKQQELDKILNFLPGMTTQNGNLQVHGKPVGSVYINRRRVQLSGQELLEYLQNYHGKNIKDIQVVTATGAEESAASGGMAMLKIITNKIEDGGMLSVRGRVNGNKADRSVNFPGINLRYVLKWGNKRAKVRNNRSSSSMESGRMQ